MVRRGGPLLNVGQWRRAHVDAVVIDRRGCTVVFRLRRSHRRWFRGLEQDFFGGLPIGVIRDPHDDFVEHERGVAICGIVDQHLAEQEGVGDEDVPPDGLLAGDASSNLIEDGTWC